MSPGGLKKPILALNRIIGHASAKNHITKPHIGNIAAVEDDPKHERQIKKLQEQRIKEDEREHERLSSQQRRKDEEERAHQDDPPEIAARYGTKTHDVLEKTDSIQKLAADPNNAGASVSFIARVHHVRCMSSKLAFVIFRDQVDLIQGVLACREGEVSENFVPGPST